MLITPICPNVRVRPRAASNRIAPVAEPVRKGVVSASMVVVSDRAIGVPGALPGTPTATGSLRVRVPPVVGLQERIGLDRSVGLVDDVELVVGVDLADQRGLGDVVVLTVDRDRALGCREG